MCVISEVEKKGISTVIEVLIVLALFSVPPGIDRLH